MADRRTDFVVRVRQPDQGDEFDLSYEWRRKVFWGPILEAFGSEHDDRRLDAGLFEDVLKRDLPKRLQSRLADLFQAKNEIGDLIGPPIPIVFAVTSISYSSMDVGVAVEPLSKLAELFEKNFDWFRVALEGFVPQAIEETILGVAAPYPRVEVLAAVRRLQHSISYESSLVEAFRSVPPEAGAREVTRAEKVKWAWIVANTSLVVPTLLAAIYLYFVHRDVRDGEKVRADEYNRIIDQHTKLLSTCGTLLSQSADRSKQVSAKGKPGSS